MRHTRRLPIALLVLVPLCLATTSCFTSMLWSRNLVDGPYHMSEANAASLDATFREGRGEGGNGIPILGKILLTPVTLILDLVTIPIQAFFFDDGHDEGHHEGDLNCDCPACRDC